MARLTRTRIQELRHDPTGPAKQVRFCSSLAGFGVRVYPSGRKSYVLRYGSGKGERLMTLGPATDGADLDDMREHAQALLRGRRTTGADPIAERRKALSGTVQAVVGDYIDARANQWAPAEAKRARGRLDRHLAAIASVSVEKLTRREVRAAHRMASEVAPVEANRTLALLRAAINWALSEGYWKAADLAEGENPAARVKANPEKHRREWLQPEELPDVLQAIDAEADPWLRAFFRMLLFTGARKGEMLNLKWADVDLRRKTVTFRATKNRDDHTLPLSAEAVKLLKALPRTLGNDYVFCGHAKGKPIVNPYKSWKRILARAGIQRRVTIHDVRRTVGSLLASSGVSTQQIGKLLNHKSAITAKVYAEIADQSKQEMTDAIARLLK